MTPTEGKQTTTGSLQANGKRSSLWAGRLRSSSMTARNACESPEAIGKWLTCCTHWRAGEHQHSVPHWIPSSQKSLTGNETRTTHPLKRTAIMQMCFEEEGLILALRTVLTAATTPRMPRCQRTSREVAWPTTRQSTACSHLTANLPPPPKKKNADTSASCIIPPGLPNPAPRGTQLIDR
jgi:hypothetical protein